MDEILASIRRIIESNEPVTQAGVATAMAEPEGFSGRPANDDSEEVSLTVDDAFADHDHDYVPAAASSSALRSMADALVQPEAHHASPSLVRERQPTLVHPAPAPQKSLSLADVAARVRAASERSTFVRDTSPVDQYHVDQHPVAERPAVVTPQSAPAAPQMAAFEAPHPEPVAESREEPALQSHHLATERHQDEEHAFQPEPVSLLSSSAGEQVARSFQDLALAIDNAERRSLDQIAEDMLRPMLQEWLDDNLPTLVERLVREEIERVARGPRR
jgi:cell pole-organizing protein PopZ